MTDAPVPIVLRCGACSHELDGLDADRTWTCRACGRAWEAAPDGLAERPYRVWRADAQGPLVHLPFWRLGHRAEVTGDDGAARDALARRVASGRTWVRAFVQRAAFAAGDPGQALTAGDAAERLEDRNLPHCVGARLGSGDAVRLAELFALASADREHDVSHVALRLDVTDVALVAVPFAEDGRDLVCAVAPVRIRRTALADPPPPPGRS